MMSNREELQKLKSALNNYQQAKRDEADRIKKAQWEERLRAEREQMEKTEFRKTVIMSVFSIVIWGLIIACGFIMLGELL